jgi:iron complex transport system substrate-binding protein
VLTFSDLQAEIVAALLRAGLEVHPFNPRDRDGILRMIRTPGARVGTAAQAEALATALDQRLTAVRQATAGRPRPRVYFEEWDEPLIAGIGWVSELIEITGGEEVFADRRTAQAARDRIVAPEEVLAARPEVILASWCGKKVSAPSGSPPGRAGRVCQSRRSSCRFALRTEIRRGAAGRSTHSRNTTTP